MEIILVPGVRPKEGNGYHDEQISNLFLANLFSLPIPENKNG